jgi:hypothetical protein
VFLDAGSNLAPSVKSAHWRPAGEMARFQLTEIAIFTAETNPFTGKIYLNEEPNITDADALGYQFTFLAPAVQYQSAKGRKYTHKPTRSVVFNALQLEVIFPSTSADTAVERILIEAVPLAEEAVA